MLHPLLQTLFSELSDNNITWCLLHTGSQRKAFPDDLDVLIEKRHISRVRRILEMVGFAQVPGGAPALGQRFLAYDASTKRCIHIKLIQHIVFGYYGRFKSKLAAELLVRRQRHEWGYTIDHSNAFWLQLFRYTVDNSNIDDSDKAELQQLVSAADHSPAMQQLVNEVDQSGTGVRQIIGFVEQNDWLGLQRYMSWFAAQWLRHDLFGIQQRLLLNRLAELGSYLVNSRRSSGLSVTVLGPDGAGKSTVADGIQEEFCMPVVTVYMGLWQRRAAASRFKRLPGAKLISMITLVASRPFFIWSRYLTAQYYQFFGRLVIFDRYIYDSLLPPRPPLAALKRPIFWLLAHLVPGPDLVFLLDAPGRLMAERKAEYDEAHLEAERQRFLSLKKRIPRMQVIDASRDLNSVRGDVLDWIWKAYMARWAANSSSARRTS